MKTLLGLLLLGLLLTGCDNIAPELLPALPGENPGNLALHAYDAEDYDAPVFVPDRRYVRAYLVSPKSREFLASSQPEFFASELEEIIFDIGFSLGEAQEFFASEMDRHGHGRMTFPIALDAAGHVHVTHLTLPEDVQFYLDGTLQELKTAFYEAYNAREPAPGEIPFFFVDTPAIEVCGHPDFVFTGCWWSVAHELGHRFGLPHDWRNGEYVMSYGETLEPDGTWTPVAYPDAKSKLSRGAAAWLSYSPTLSGRRVSSTFYYWVLSDYERDMAPVEGNTGGLHQFRIRFNASFRKSPADPTRGPQPAPELNETGGFVMARLIERTASNVENFKGGNVVRYLDKDDLQFTFQDGTGPWKVGDNPWLRDDYLHYDLRFTAHLRADTEEVYLQFLLPNGYWN